MSSSVIVDADSVKNLQRKFLMMSSKEQRKYHRDSLKKAMTVVRAEALKNFDNIVGKAIARHRNSWDGKRLRDGIVLRVSNKNGKLSCSVHILSDFRLKFFENGTDDRFTGSRAGRGMERQKFRKNANTNRRSYRGTMKATNFFFEARKSKEQESLEVLETMTEKILTEIWRD